MNRDAVEIFQEALRAVDPRAAVSGLSDACTRFFWLLRPKSPRIVPTSALMQFVAPFILRTCATASRPSHTICTVGPEVTKAASSG